MSNKMKMTAAIHQKHGPKAGALYRCKKSANGPYKLRANDIVMVVSKAPSLKETKYVKEVNKQEVETVVQEWTDLSILWNEQIIDMEGTRETTWFLWFERIDYDDKSQ